MIERERRIDPRATAIMRNVCSPGDGKTGAKGAVNFRRRLVISKFLESKFDDLTISKFSEESSGNSLFYEMISIMIGSSSIALAAVNSIINMTTIGIKRDFCPM